MTWLKHHSAKVLSTVSNFKSFRQNWLVLSPTTSRIEWLSTSTISPLPTLIPQYQYSKPSYAYDRPAKISNFKAFRFIQIRSDISGALCHNRTISHIQTERIGLSPTSRRIKWFFGKTFRPSALPPSLHPNINIINLPALVTGQIKSVILRRFDTSRSDHWIELLSSNRWTGKMNGPFTIFVWNDSFSRENELGRAVYLYQTLKLFCWKV